MSAGTTLCLDCGKQRPLHRRVSGGVLCAACDRRQGGTIGTCRDCAACKPLVSGPCAACRLRQRVSRELYERAAPAAASRLAPYLYALAATASPSSALRWIQSPAFTLLARLLDGEVELSDAALDRAQGEASEARAVAFLRAGLVHHACSSRAMRRSRPSRAGSSAR